MSIRDRIATIRGLIDRPWTAEAVIVVSLIVIGGIFIYLSFSGELAKLLVTTTPSYVPGT